MKRRKKRARQGRQARRESKPTPCSSPEEKVADREISQATAAPPRLDEQTSSAPAADDSRPRDDTREDCREARGEKDTARTDANSTAPTLDAPARALAAKLSALSSDSHDRRSVRGRQETPQSNAADSISTSRQPGECDVDRIDRDAMAASRQRTPDVESSTLVPRAGSTRPPRHKFTAQKNLTPTQLRGLENAHKNFARAAQAKMAAVIRRKVNVELTEIHQTTYFEFLRTLPNPTCLFVVEALPESLELVVELGQSIAGPLIDQLLGGRAEDATHASAPLTMIEQEIIATALDDLLDSLADSWAPWSRIQFQRGRCERTPLNLQIFDADQLVVVVAMRLRCAGHSGTFHLCLPARPFAAILSSFSSSGKTQARGSDKDARRQRLFERLADTSVELQADLPSIPVRLHDLLTLRCGDVLDTQLARATEVSVKVQDRLLHRGPLTNSQGRRAVRVTERLSETSSVRRTPRSQAANGTSESLSDTSESAVDSAKNGEEA